MLQVPSLTYREVPPERLPQVASFNGRFLERRNAEHILRWEFYDPALPQPGFVLGAFDGDELVGTQAFIPFSARYRGEHVLSAKSELTLLDPRYRGQGIFGHLYELGFALCEQRAIECVWGFTSALKPFRRVGFEIGDHLYTEDVLAKPVRFAASRKGLIKSHGEHAQVAIRASMPDPAAAEFSLQRTEDYLTHRYVNNPVRRAIHFDEEAEVLYSAGASGDFVYVSECVSVDAMTRSVRRALRAGRRGRWRAVRRITNRPAFGPLTAPGSLPLRRASPTAVVWRWLGKYTGHPLPSMHVEEGLTEGTA